MKKLELLGLAAAFSVAGWAHAQQPVQEQGQASGQQQQTQDQSTSQTQQAPTTPRGATGTTGTTGPTDATGATRTGTTGTTTDTTGTTTSPAPATSPAEGTAADRTPPGVTPDREVTPGTANPVPATSRAEGTAADRSEPGETPVRGAAADQAPEAVTSQMVAEAGGQQMMGERRVSNLIGMDVRSTDGSSLGKVTDIIVDPRSGQITHVIISRDQMQGQTAQRQGAAGQGMLTAVPWSQASNMIQRGSIVIDESKLQSAPGLSEQELAGAGTTWSAEADRYWGEGVSRTATGEKWPHHLESAPTTPPAERGETLQR